MDPTSLVTIFDILCETYGPQFWWPADSAFEVIVGAVLTQNTAWHNVTLAMANLRAKGFLSRSALLEARPEEAKALIKPSGFYNVKYGRLRSILEYLGEHESERFANHPISGLRDELLGVRGIGPETADSILLYAFGRPVFVVDAFTRRLFSRLGWSWMETASYEEVQRFFMTRLPARPALFNEYHALIVTHCKKACRKAPLCQACILERLCDWVATSKRRSLEQCSPPGG